MGNLATRGTKRGSVRLLLGLVVLVVVAIGFSIFVPIPIPDTHSPTGATAYGEINDWTSVGHTFRMDRDGLCRIEVPLTTLKRTSTANVQFYIREEADGPNLRSMRIELTKLQEGKILDFYSARWQDLPWVVFDEFEPLYGYAGKQLYFNIEGKDIPKENTVQSLFSYPNGYDRGEAFKAEKPADAGMVFRTYTKGTLVELSEITFPLLAEGRPGFLGWQWVYQAVVGSIVALVLFLFTIVVRLAAQEEDHQ